jgi:acetylornithine deacetylase
MKSENLFQYIDDQENQVVEFLCDLIKINSVTGSEGNIQKYIGKTLREMNLEVDQFEPDVAALRHYPGFLEPDGSFAGRPNTVGVWHGSGSGKSLLLNGHVDTVPFDLAGNWSFHQLIPKVQGGLVWGLGASDMKSGLAAMTMAVRFLQEYGFTPVGDVILQYTVDEERTGLGTLACVQRGYNADAGICCETSDLEVMPACIGRMWFRVDIQGKPTGISARWEGVSAIEEGIKVVQAVSELEKRRIKTLHHPLYRDNRGALPCAVTMFESGTFPSITPDKAVLRGSMGLMPYEDPDEVRQEFIDHIYNTTQGDSWLSVHKPQVSTEHGYVAAGAEIPTDHPIVATLKRAFEEAKGEDAIISGRMGAADTRFLIRNGRTPSVIFGPGVTAQMHAVNENVPVENLIVATKVLAYAILEWCGGNILNDKTT